MNISQRLRTCARHTGLDAVIELLNEAADEIDSLHARANGQATQPAEVTDEREAFEAEMRCEDVWGHRSLKKRSDGRYENWLVDLMWDVWQARSKLTIPALRPVQVPMTEGTARQFVEWMKAQPEDREPTTIDGALAEFEVSIGIPNGAPPHDLWCIHIPGPDEVHAAPSKEAAEHMAAKHNAAMAMYYASGALNLEHAPPLESVQAVVVKWPHDQQSHADELREFDYASWGITAQAKKEDA